MKIKITDDVDNGCLKNGSIYDVLEPESASVSNKDSPHFKTMYLVITPNPEMGHTSDSSVPAWWVSQEKATVIERDTICGLVKIGQRWMWDDGDYKKYVVEILDLKSGNKMPGFVFPQITTKVVHSINGNRKLNEECDYGFNAQTIWKYLTGQDAPDSL